MKLLFTLFTFMSISSFNEYKLSLLYTVTISLFISSITSLATFPLSITIPSSITPSLVDLFVIVTKYNVTLKYDLGSPCLWSVWNAENKNIKRKRNHQNHSSIYCYDILLWLLLYKNDTLPVLDDCRNLQRGAIPPPGTRRLRWLNSSLQFDYSTVDCLGHSVLIATI